MNQFKSINLTFLLLFLFSGEIMGQGVSLVKDINQNGNGITNSGENYFAAVGDFLFFVASDGTSGKELWMTDGSEGSTKMVKDIMPGEETSELHGLIEHNGLCYFFADDGVNGKELWSSDGTDAGTQMVVDINQGSGSSLFNSFEYLTSYNGSLFFEAYDGDKDKFWVVDSNDNANLFSEVPGSNFISGITGTHVMNDVLYFFRKESFDGLYLHKYDGNQLTEIEQFGLGNIITHIVDSEGILYYSIQEGFGEIIWAYDSNTEMNKMLYSSSATLHSSISHNGQLYFSEDGDPTLYLLDVNLIEPIILSETTFSFADEPTAFEIFDNMVYYFGESSNDGVHRTDGTSSGTELLFDINQVSFDSDGIHSIGQELLIAGEDTFYDGEELFISDGESYIELVSDINPNSNDSEPTGFIDLGANKTFFIATTQNEGRELWVYNKVDVSTSDLVIKSFSVYPSLVTNSIVIKSNSEGLSSKVNVAIYDNRGKVILSGELSSLSNMNTSKWLSGTYYITIEFEGRSETHKVIKI